MKVKTKIRFGVLLAMFSSVFIVLGAHFAPETNVSAEVGSLQANATISAKYELGSILEIPTGNILYSGETYVADTYYLKKPSGVVYEGRNHTLDELGNYTIVYSMKNESLLLTAEQDFSVVQPVYGISSQYSSVAYAEKLTRDNVSGVQVSLADGDRFVFNEPININETDKFFSFYPYGTYWSDVVNADKPNGGYTYDISAEKYIVRLTDCYDCGSFEYRVTLCCIDCSNSSVEFCLYLIFHLHGFEHSHGLTGLDCITDIHID